VASGELKPLGDEGILLPRDVTIREARTYAVDAAAPDGTTRRVNVTAEAGSLAAGQPLPVSPRLTEQEWGGKGATFTLVMMPRVPIRLVDVMGVATAIVLMIVLDWLVFRTRTGRAMRAVSYNTNNAALMGIDVDKVVSLTFVIGAALAAAAGFLFSQKYTGLNQTAASIWVLLGLKAFVAAVVGGIGNIRGAMLGGLLIGLLEFFGMAYVSTELRDLYVFSLLIVVLLVKPSGILGSTIREKV
jgi:branched-chain amino acid transport system permease protein